MSWSIWLRFDRCVGSGLAPTQVRTLVYMGVSQVVLGTRDAAVCAKKVSPRNSTTCFSTDFVCVFCICTKQTWWLMFLKSLARNCTLMRTERGLSDSMYNICFFIFIFHSHSTRLKEVVPQACSIGSCNRLASTVSVAIPRNTCYVSSKSATWILNSTWLAHTCRNGWSIQVLPATLLSFLCCIQLFRKPCSDVIFAYNVLVVYFHFAECRRKNTLTSTCTKLLMCWTFCVANKVPYFCHGTYLHVTTGVYCARKVQPGFVSEFFLQGTYVRLPFWHDLLHCFDSISDDIAACRYSSCVSYVQCMCARISALGLWFLCLLHALSPQVKERHLILQTTVGFGGCPKLVWPYDVLSLASYDRTWPEFGRWS